MSHYIILHQSYSRFLFPNLTWRIPSLSCLARCARRERVNEPSPKLQPRVVYFQAAARNPPTTSLACLRIWPPPCPSRLIAQMPELATVSPRVAAMVAEALRAPPSPPQGCRHPHSQCCRCLCDAAGRRWFLAVEAISGIPGVEPKCTA